MKSILSFLGTACILFLIIQCNTQTKEAKTNMAQSDIQDSIHSYVDDMARFPGCEDFAGDKKVCAEEKLLKYIYDTIQYPAYAEANLIQGRVVISFVVEKDGSLTNFKIVKDIGGGCGEAALQAAKSMTSLSSKWVAGKLNGEIVRSIFILPISYKIKEKSPENTPN